MPITVERHSSLPVLLFTYSGAIALEDMINAYYQSLQLLTPDDQVVYRVIHVKSLDSNFADILKMVQSSASNQPPSAAEAEHEMPMVVVGYDKWTKLYLQMMSQPQFGAVTIPCFSTVDLALNFVSGQINKEAS